MPTKTRKSNLNSVHVENIGPRSKKRSLSCSTSSEENKTRFGPTTPKRYKTLLTCTICDGDAHGN